MNAYDPASFTAAELLGYFNKNTAIKVEHTFGKDKLVVKSARTGNIIATVERDHDHGLYFVDEQFDFLSLEIAANYIMMNARFPKPKRRNKSFSPIRLNVAALKLQELDSDIRFA